MIDPTHLAAVELILRDALEDERVATQAVLSRIRALAEDLFVLRVAQTASLRARDALLEALPTHGTSIAPVQYTAHDVRPEALRHAHQLGPVFYRTFSSGAAIEREVVAALEQGGHDERAPLLALPTTVKDAALSCNASSCGCGGDEARYTAHVEGETIWIETPEDGAYQLPLARLGAQVALAPPEARAHVVTCRPSGSVYWPDLGVTLSHAYLRGQRALMQSASRDEASR